MEDQPPTVLRLPASLPYPVTLHSLELRPGHKVERGQRILRYSYVSSTDDFGRQTEQADIRFATWDSPIGGEVIRWERGVRQGTVIAGPGQPLIHIQQPCSHPVTVFDMCAICGIDTTQSDYLSAPAYASGASDVSSQAGPSRHDPHAGSSISSVQITHDMPTLRVSMEEAHRLALESRQRLLKDKKLILVVDLDLTIVHAVADPTVGDWMDEIGGPSMGVVPVSDERDTDQTRTGRDLTVDKGKGKAGDSHSDGDALRDVYRFQLTEGPLQAQRRQARPGFPENGPSSRNLHRNWYYIKPRPGLPNFLETMSQLYEMHVYTAGSRSYADAVCRCIDPKGKYFNERILSRDESGSAASKDLRRLFPTDQSMVVVIDDRWEVWNHAPNLVKVRPFDFFAGLGDINGAFVQPRATDSLTGSSAPGPLLVPSGSTSTDVETNAADVLAQEQARDVENQVEARPLRRKQEEMSLDPLNGGDQLATSGPPTLPAAQGEGQNMINIRRALLRNDDVELERISGILREVHSIFFAELTKHGGGFRVAPSQTPHSRIMFDVRHIIPRLERKVFAGCVFLFSGIISIGQTPEDNEWWFLATLFGAKCVSVLGSDVTHVITAKPDTQKVYEALRMPVIKVVHKSWLVESLDLWRRLPEEPFLVALSGAAPPPASSSIPPVEQSTLQTASNRGDSDGPAVDDIVDRSTAVELPVGLEEADFDEMDAELREFMGSDDEGSLHSESSAGMDADASEGGSEIPSLTPRRNPPPVKSSLRRTHSQSSSSGGFGTDSDTQPVKKRARFERDQRDDARGEYVDIVDEGEEEDYDEYVDGGSPGDRGELLSDGEDDDLPQQRDDGGVDRLMRESMEGGSFGDDDLSEGV